jgi:aminopeptidase N
MDVVDPDALHAARNGLRRHLAEGWKANSRPLRRAGPDGAYRPSSEQAGRRALRNVCLAYLLELDTGRHPPAGAAAVPTAPTT